MNLKRSLSLRKARTESLKIHFFDDVCIEDKKLKDDIMDWISRLNYNKNISINKFSDLFSKFEAIVFPIEVYGCPHHLQIKDNLGKEYYLNYFQLDYTKLEEYSIGRIAFPLDKKFIYQLSSQTGIVLKQILLLKLDEDNNNTDI